MVGAITQRRIMMFILILKAQRKAEFHIVDVMQYHAHT